MNRAYDRNRMLPLALAGICFLWKHMGASRPLRWMDWLNLRPLVEPVGDIPPAETEARYPAKSEGGAMAACLSQIDLR